MRMLDRERPWFVKGSIELLDELLTPAMNALEFGSGGSTLFLARRVKHVVSFEDDKRWFGGVVKTLKAKGLSNVRMVLYEQRKLKRSFPKEPSTYNCIIIDNKSCGKVGVNRRSLLKQCLPLLQTPKILVLDNYGLFRISAELGKYMKEECGLVNRRTFNDPMWKGYGTQIYYD